MRHYHKKNVDQLLSIDLKGTVKIQYRHKTEFTDRVFVKY